MWALIKEILWFWQRTKGAMITQAVEIQKLTEAMEQFLVASLVEYEEDDIYKEVTLALTADARHLCESPEEAAYQALETRFIDLLRQMEAEAIWSDARKKILAILATEGLVNQGAYITQIIRRARRQILEAVRMSYDRRRLAVQETATTVEPPAKLPKKQVKSAKPKKKTEKSL